jgi:hypothetical protein
MGLTSSASSSGGEDRPTTGAGLVGPQSQANERITAPHQGDPARAAVRKEPPPSHHISAGWRATAGIVQGADPTT